MDIIIVAATSLCFLFGAIPPFQTGGAQKTAQRIGPEALWQPGMQAMQTIQEKCSSGTNFGDCFASQMQKFGASPQAVAFTELTDNTGYMRDFRDAGQVDVAYVNYPFRANENQGCLLVNGNPRVVDVDDTSALSKDNLQSNAQYAALAQKYPNIAIFPGDRNGTAYPTAEKLANGGQRFIVAYWLVNGCHACERIGSAKVAFDFDRGGKFLGRKLLTVGEPQGAATQTSEGDAAGAEPADSTTPLHERIGQEFTLRMAANRTTGYQWQLAEPIDETIVKQVGTAYEESKTKLTGAGGTEVWTFRAVGKGKAAIKMKYVRPWEKNAMPAKSTVFVVQVE